MIAVLYLLAGMGWAMLAVGLVAWVLAAMTYPGWGGQQAPPQNASPAAQLVPGVQPGTTGQIVASRVIITGSTGGDLFVYSGAPAAGNLLYSVSGSTVPFLDPKGNHCVPLTGWYDNAGGFFTQIGAGFVTFGTGSLAGGWTANTSVQNDASGNLLLGATGNLQFNGTVMTVP